MTDRNSRIHSDVASYYSQRLREFGATAKGVDWKDQEGQFLRFAELSRVVLEAPLSEGPYSITDYGCGYGAFLEFMQQRFPEESDFQFLGLDLVDTMIQAARERFSGEPRARFLQGHEPDVITDFAIASGIFNVCLDTDHEVTAFCVDAAYLKEDSFCGCPITPFEGVEKRYPPEKYSFFVALSYTKLNILRRQKFEAAKALGYRLVSYVSPHATILSDGQIGENCFILEDNTIQPFVTIGDNVTLWSGNHIGHHSTVESHCFISSHVVISGGVTVEEQCFLGINSTLRDGITIGARSVIGAGAVILGNVEPEGVYITERTERSRLPSSKLRGI